MKDRLQELLTRERLTPVRFSELVEVQRSSVSHVLSGRNKPSLDFIQKILTAFPHVSPDWLLLGQGSYGRASAGTVSTKEEGDPGDEVRQEERAPYHRQGELFDRPGHEAWEQGPKAGALPDSLSTRPGATDLPTGAESERRVVKMVFFYDDRTFEVFHPGP